MKEEPQAGLFLRIAAFLLTSGTSVATAGQVHGLGRAAEADARRRDGRERDDRQC
jgi:hypothetical protein